MRYMKFIGILVLILTIAGCGTQSGGGSNAAAHLGTWDYTLKVGNTSPLTGTITFTDTAPNEAGVRNAVTGTWASSSATEPSTRPAAFGENLVDGRWQPFVVLAITETTPYTHATVSRTGTDPLTYSGTGYYPIMDMSTQFSMTKR